MSEPIEHTIVAAPDTPLSLERAVEVLNRVRHNGRRDWQVSAPCSGREFRAFACGPGGQGGNLTALAMASSAEYYVRHGIEQWPGWEWGG